MLWKDGYFAITVGTHEEIHTVGSPYLSFNIDSASLYQDADGGRLNFSDPQLNYLTKKLCTASSEGAYIRIGGSSADNLVFVSGNDNEHNKKFKQEIRIDFEYWDSIIKFVDESGCKLIWDLCALSLRNSDNSWNTTNAEMLFDHIVRSNQSIYGLQLGNEPGHWNARHASGPGAVQLGKDLVTLYKLVAEKLAGKTKPFLFGPDVCGPALMTESSPCSTVHFFTDIIHAAQQTLRGVTVHHYGLASAHKYPNNCNLDDFLDPQLIFMQEKKYDIWRISKEKVVGAKIERGIDMILGETASSGSGGCENLSNTFAAGFWWIHTLGEMATLKYDQIFRQNLVGWSGIGDMSHYTLAGDPGWSGAYTRDDDNNDIPPTALFPNPDYFISFLWMKLTSPIVLRLDLGRSASVLGVSLHAHCAARKHDQTKGAIVLSFANTRRHPVYVNSLFGEEMILLGVVPRAEYFLSTNNLRSRHVMLNDKYISKTDIDIGGRIISEGDIQLPPLTLGFIVLLNCQAPACIRYHNNHLKTSMN